MKRIYIWFLQRIANTLIRRLNEIENDKIWSQVFAQALGFDAWCVNQDIYLN